MLRLCQEVPGPTVRTHSLKSFVFDQSDQKEDGRCRLVRCAEKWGPGRSRVFSCLFRCVSYTMKARETHSPPSSRHLRTPEGLTGKGEAGQGTAEHHVAQGPQHHTIYTGTGRAPHTQGLCLKPHPEVALLTATERITVIYSPRRQGASQIFIHLCWEEEKGPTSQKAVCLRAQSVHHAGHEGSESSESLTDTQEEHHTAGSHNCPCPQPDGDMKNVTLFEVGTDHVPR